MRGFLIGAVVFAAMLTSVVPVSANPASTQPNSTDIPELTVAHAVTLESPGSRYPGDTIAIRGSTSLSRIVVQVLRPNQTLLWTSMVSQDHFAAGLPLTLPADVPYGAYTILAGSGNYRAEAVFQVVERQTGQDYPVEEEPEEPPPTPEPSEPAPTASLKQLPDGTAVLSLKPEQPNAAGLAQLVIPAEALEQAKALHPRAISLEPILPEGTTGVEAILPAQTLTYWPADTRVELHTSFAKVRIPVGELTGNSPEGITHISLFVNRLSTAPGAITMASQLEAIRSKPMVEVRLKRDGHLVNATSGRNGITVELPYSPTQTERNNMEALVVWSLKQENIIKPIINSRYAPSSGSIIFRSSSFGVFAAAYSPQFFTDMDNAQWATSPVAALAARGVIQGVSEREFAPDRTVTRGDYVLLLMRAFEPVKNEQPYEAFPDVPPEAYYYDAVATAKSLGIAGGDGQNFHPEAAITRQDMMVLADRIIRAAGTLPSSPLAPLNSFSDHMQVAPYAQESISRLAALDVVQGTGGQLEPLRSTTRAEAAALIHRLLIRLQPES